MTLFLAAHIFSILDIFNWLVGGLSAKVFQVATFVQVRNGRLEDGGRELEVEEEVVGSHEVGPGHEGRNVERKNGKAFLFKDQMNINWPL